MSEIERLEAAQENLQRAIGAFSLQISDNDKKIAELKKSEKAKNIGVSMTEQQGMIAVSISENGNQKSQYIYECWDQVFRELPTEEEFKRK